MSHQFTRPQQELIAKVRGRTETLKAESKPGLIAFVDRLREQALHSQNDTQHLGVDAISASVEAVRRVLGYELYDVQILAANALILNQIVEMQTGEGKTISALPAAVYGGILGRGSHVATPNGYLATRDYHQLQPVYESLGMTIGLLDTSPESKTDKHQAYACDITYGPAFEFGFDYLRDQILLKSQSKLPAGQQLLDRLKGRPCEPPTQQRGLAFSIVDEADNVLIDDASSPQVLSEFVPGDAPDADAVQLAHTVSRRLILNQHYRETGIERIELTSDGTSYIHDPKILIPAHQLIRPWSKYIEAALQATHCFRRDVHYVVEDDVVRIVEQSTGRIFTDRSWQSGLHQAVEAKEQLPITPESLPIAQITRQRFYQAYSHLSGMTGTTLGCVSELHTVYGLGCTSIPLRLTSQRQYWPLRAFATVDKKWLAILESVKLLHQSKRPILIGTRTIVESEYIADLLRRNHLSFQLLNGKQDADEAEIVSQAGAQGAITIATNLAGRGTDIKLKTDVKELGGLHVIVSESHGSGRVDRQLVGRCARQGNPGSCQTFISADDWLLTTYAPWLSETLRKIARNNEAPLDLEPRIKKIQLAIERSQFSNRLALLQENERKNRIFGG